MKLGVVMYAFNHSTWGEAKAGRSLTLGDSLNEFQDSQNYTEKFFKKPNQPINKQN